LDGPDAQHPQCLNLFLNRGDRLAIIDPQRERNLPDEEVQRHNRVHIQGDTSHSKLRHGNVLIDKVAQHDDDCKPRRCLQAHIHCQALQ
jgi:hypothetical protein